MLRSPEWERKLNQSQKKANCCPSWWFYLEEYQRMANVTNQSREILFFLRSRYRWHEIPSTANHQKKPSPYCAAFLVLALSAKKLGIYLSTPTRTFSLHHPVTTIPTPNPLSHQHCWKNSFEILLIITNRYCGRNARFPVDSSRHRKFQKCTARVLIRPDSTGSWNPRLLNTHFREIFRKSSNT